MNSKLRKRSAPGLTYVTIDSGLALARKVLRYWHCTTTMAALSYNFIPLVNQQKQLPLPAWYPFDVYESKFFELFYVLESYGQTWQAQQFANGCGTAAYVFVLITSQIDMLCASIKNIPYTALIRHGINKNHLLKMQENLKNTYQEINQFSTGDKIELLEDFSLYESVYFVQSTSHEVLSDFNLTPDAFKNPKLKKCLKEAFIDCIHHHEEIISMSKDYQNLMSTFFLLKLADITGLMTLILIAITTTQDSTRAIVFCEYLTIPSIELFILCYYGTNLTHQSSKLINAVMNSDWYLYAGALRSEVSIFLAETVKPIFFTGSGLFRISIETLISV
ncbi:odorant receptor 83a-like [Culicoides brevitarsis]|uniref:odorant receptor 83a-like n=1 Tax=Culicoides brevitarsis TaxID=469753 RepID=UPI00307C241D